VVGFLERLHDLLVGLLALRSACPADEDPDRGLPRFDFRIVTVGQNLNPLDRLPGEGRPQPFLDTVRRCILHVVLRELFIMHILHVYEV